jgi:hypothetical protein
MIDPEPRAAPAPVRAGYLPGSLASRRPSRATPRAAVGRGAGAVRDDQPAGGSGRADGRTLGRRLVERLNAAKGCERPWACWDGELIEKVAADHHVSQSLIDAVMEGRVRSWFQELLDGLPWGRARPEGADLDEYQIYCRVALTVRTLASAGGWSSSAGAACT